MASSRITPAHVDEKLQTFGIRVTPPHEILQTSYGKAVVLPVFHVGYDVIAYTRREKPVDGAIGPYALVRGLLIDTPENQEGVRVGLHVRNIQESIDVPVVGVTRPQDPKIYEELRRTLMKNGYKGVEPTLNRMWY